MQTYVSGEGIGSILAKILINQGQFIVAAGPIIGSAVILNLAVLPNAVGYLKNDGAGNLSWIAASGGSSNSYTPSGW